LYKHSSPQLESEACNVELYNVKKDPEERQNLAVSALSGEASLEL
jgi:hypothetical protein